LSPLCRSSSQNTGGDKEVPYIRFYPATYGPRAGVEAQVTLKNRLNQGRAELASEFQDANSLRPRRKETTKRDGFDDDEGADLERRGVDIRQDRRTRKEYILDLRSCYQNIHYGSEAEIEREQGSEPVNKSRDRIHRISERWESGSRIHRKQSRILWLVVRVGRECNQGGHTRVSPWFPARARSLQSRTLRRVFLVTPHKLGSSSVPSALFLQTSGCISFPSSIIYFKFTHIQDEVVDGMEAGVIISSLNAAIIIVDLAGSVSLGILLIQSVFRAVGAFLTNLRVGSLFINDLLQVHTSRTRWSTRWNVYTNPGWSALIIVERLTG